MAAALKPCGKRRCCSAFRLCPFTGVGGQILGEKGTSPARGKREMEKLKRGEEVQLERREEVQTKETEEDNS